MLRNFEKWYTFLILHAFQKKNDFFKKWYKPIYFKHVIYHNLKHSIKSIIQSDNILSVFRYDIKHITFRIYLIKDIFINIGPIYINIDIICCWSSFTTFLSSKVILLPLCLFYRHALYFNHPSLHYCYTKLYSRRQNF